MLFNIYRWQGCFVNFTLTEGEKFIVIKMPHNGNSMPRKIESSLEKYN
jgi:hypothetical protein